MDITLRDYQSRSVHEIFAVWRAGYRSVVLVAPTGFGKRVLALWLMDYAAQSGRRVLFVGNRRLLITQAQADAEKYGLDHGVVMADAESGNAASTNQIASIQTLESWYFYDKWSSVPAGTGLPPCDLLVIDECHQEGERYKQLMAFYPNAKVLGLTATPVGPNGISLVPSMFETLVEPVLNSQLIQRFHDTGEGLLPTKVYAPSEPSIEGVKIVKKGEYNQAQLSRAVHSCTVFGDVFAEWQKHATGRATVCFVPGIPFGRDLVRQFNFLLGAGTAHLIEAKTKHHEREEILGRIAAGTSRVIVSCDVLREGFDLPILSCGIDLQPNSQFRSYWQKLGRIKRPFPGQSDALWLDFAGNSWRFTHPDHDPIWPVGEETSQEAIQKARQEGKQAAPIICPECQFVREKGPQCPNCGHRHSESIRRVRMGNGKLKELKAEFKQKVEKTAEQKLLSKWSSQLYGALYSGRTFGQCARLFQEATGERPKSGWLGVFGNGDLLWTDKVKSHYKTPRDLAMALRRRK